MHNGIRYEYSVLFPMPVVLEYNNMPSIRAEWVGTLDGSLKSHGFNT